jgi:hypothetical protein
MVGLGHIASWRAGRRRRLGCLAATLALIGVGCTSTDSPSPAATPAASAQVNLKGLCPDPLVAQTSWYPQSEHGELYQLLGNDYRIDAAHKRVTGTFTVRGKSTGVRLEIRAGGPAVGNQTAPALMYQDPTITLGMLNPDQIMQLYDHQPVVGVVAPMELDAQVIFWSPAAHPDWHTIADIGQTDTKVLYFQGLTFMDYLIGSGILQKQIDSSYDGSPSRFVASRGQIAVQGYATNEPYTLQHEVKAWGKPVAYQLITDTGYPNYANVLAVKADRRDALDACLHRLVPMLQQAQVDFITNPAAAIDKILKVNDAYHGGFVYSRGNALFAVQQMRSLGIVANGGDQTLGNFDTGRLARLLQIVGPIFAGQKKPLPANLGPAKVATNAYIDPAIGLHQ